MNITQKKSLFHVGYSITDYEEATRVIIKNAINKNSFGVSALAVHGLIESYNDKILRGKVNKIDMVLPDGQPVRWALNAIHRANLKDRVCGPELTRWVLEESHNCALKIYLYGSTEDTLQRFRTHIETTYPKINICGVHIDRFRDATPEEDLIDIQKINHAAPHIVLVGRGCPRQEKWVSDHLGKINSVMMAVGAAFDFHAGTVKRAPSWMQKRGLEWLFRLSQEPQKLWKRYLFTNSHFIYLFFKQILFTGTSSLSREEN
jgi:N-acetylglucosaminyldiphosphoundecaprenol N-acetyl-beta-D-mannosaminyltransferase